jgi:hypothetical protein
VSLSPPHGFGPAGFPIAKNAIQDGSLSPYLDTKRFPNIALISVPVASARLLNKTPSKDSPMGTVERLKLQRSTLDVPQLLLRWLGYCWGVGVPSSPLADGFGIPGAAVVEAAFAAAGFDLTPGLESRSSCPEAIWQAARWWHLYYKSTGTGEAMTGAYTCEHNLVPDTVEGPKDRTDPTSQPSAARGKRKKAPGK